MTNMMDTATKKKYNYWQWRTLVALIVGYIFYYFLRKNFSAAIPAMEETLGITKVHLGIFLSLNGIVYGISRFVNGFIADRYNRRVLMTLGLVLSCIINFAICFSPKIDGFINVLDADGKATVALVYIIGSLWVLNGYVHGMGYPPCASLMAHWFRPSELATKQSIWNSSHSIGAGIVVALCGWMLSKFGYSNWQLCFAVPAALSLVGAVALYAALRDTPSSVGLPEIEELEAEENGGAAVPVQHNASEDHNLTGAAFKKFVNRMVFRNPYIWIVAVADFCVYVIRFTILEWGTSFLTQYKGFDISLSASIVAASELIGGVLGTLVAGWFTDRYMKNRTIRTCVICMLGATVSFICFWLTPSDAPWIFNALFIVLSSFFVYGPQALLGVSASQYATKKASASANGFVGIFCYAATLISGVGFGWMAGNESMGWNAVFIVTFIFGILGALILALMWNAPADGYRKADKVLAEISAGQ